MAPLPQRTSAKTIINGLRGLTAAVKRLPRRVDPAFFRRPGRFIRLRCGTVQICGRRLGSVHSGYGRIHRLFHLPHPLPVQKNVRHRAASPRRTGVRTRDKIADQMLCRQTGVRPQGFDMLAQVLADIHQRTQRRQLRLNLTRLVCPLDSMEKAKRNRTDRQNHKRGDKEKDQSAKPPQLGLLPLAPRMPAARSCRRLHYAPSVVHSSLEKAAGLRDSACATRRSMQPASRSSRSDWSCEIMPLGPPVSIAE